MSISTVFAPDAELDPAQPDLVLISADNVFFYVHTYRVSLISTNSFASLLPPKTAATPASMTIPTSATAPTSSADVLNIVLHSVYGLPCTHLCPSIPTLRASFPALEKYGIPPSTHEPLHVLLRAAAPATPLDVYALAAAHDIAPVAMAASPYLLSLALSTLSEAQAREIGPRYLLKLIQLHTNRTDTFKRLLLAPPKGHVPTPRCEEQQQRGLARAWMLVAAQLAWDVNPSTSTHEIQVAFRRIADSLTCRQCAECLHTRVQELVTDWAGVKRTI
ncbi:hypothetical protein CERSUDRAFT_153746 [Gelatoporia subvermispora B]|uniref:BTB domain-containing protein n=1 Tax=Ceriporiopsis subvermispora (strain B) TaxID=914234 RepID=M2RFL0_CERS8|nr:hypothetical protein CERSUDRAFT_153746 [Gelatoporia subvermispora B]